MAVKAVRNNSEISLKQLTCHDYILLEIEFAPYPHKYEFVVYHEQASF